MKESAYLRNPSSPNLLADLKNFNLPLQPRLRAELITFNHSLTFFSCC